MRGKSTSPDVGWALAHADKVLPTVRRHAFTLVELLVVVSMIAVLMAILLPLLGRARLVAKSVNCQSNLRQCGLAFWATETESETDGRLGQWETVKARLYQTQDPLLCPLATKVLWDTWEQALAESSAATGRGATFAAWGHRVQPDGKPGPRGSYGANSWAFADLPPPPSASKEFRAYYRWQWLPSEMEGRAYVPVLLDSRYPAARPDDRRDAPPAAEDLWGPWFIGISDFCINRHQGHVNALFGDASVRKTGLKELWTLKWHKQFDTSNRWTKAGGVQPEDWPVWMRRFKDY